MNDNEWEKLMKTSKPEINVDPAFPDRVMDNVAAKPKNRFSAWMALVPALVVVAVVAGVLLLKNPTNNGQQVANNDQSNSNSQQTDNTDSSKQTQIAEVDAALGDIESQINSLPASDYGSDVLSDSALYN